MSNSFEVSNSILISAWSDLSSAVAPVFDLRAISDTLIREEDLASAAKLYSLPWIPDLDFFHTDDGAPVYLGAGASYRVYARKLKRWDKLVAVKHLRSIVSPGNIWTVPSAEEQRLSVLREIHALAPLNGHPNVVNLLGGGQLKQANEPVAFLITEYAPLGNLDSFLRDGGHRLKSSHLFKICADTANGFNAMHMRNMAHGDVKAANVLLFEDSSSPGQFIAKISDLGFSIDLSRHDSSAAYRGTDLYNAPEIRGQGSKQLHDFDLLACDVYSFGLLVWTVFNQGSFFLQNLLSYSTVDSTYEEILDTIQPSRLREYAIDFARGRRSQNDAQILEVVLSACLQVDPVDRSSMDRMGEVLSISPQQTLVSMKAKLSSKIHRNRFNQPGAIDIFQYRNLPYSDDTKKRLAQMLLRAAQNSRNPRAADLAFEVSKCYAVAFGVPKAAESMEHWIGVAAERGHEPASVLAKKLKSSETRPVCDAGSPPSNIGDVEATTVLLNIKRGRSTEYANTIPMDHITNFDILSGTDMVAAKLAIQKSISEGRNINTVVGISTEDCNKISKVLRLPLLHWAAWGGRTELLQIMLDFGVNIDAVESLYHATALKIALSEGQIKAAQMLLEAGACTDRPDKFGWTAAQMLFAIPPNKFDTILRLIEGAPKSIGKLSSRTERMKLETPLSAAVEYGHIQAVKAIITQNRNTFSLEQFSKAIEYAVKNNHAEICDCILQKAIISLGTLRDLPNPFAFITQGSPYDLLLFHGKNKAVALDYTIRILSRCGFDINGYDAEGKTAIHAALSNYAQDTSVALTLIAHGANLDVISKDGALPLRCAISAVANSQNEGCVRFLLDQGVPLVVEQTPPQGKQYCNDPLQFACWYKAYGAAKVILEQPGTDINWLSFWAMGTALHVACSLNALDIVQLLLEHGASVDLVNEDGKTPLEVAIDSSCINVVEYFLTSDLPVHNAHHKPPRSALDFCVSRNEPDQTRLIQLMFRSPRFRSEVLADSTAHSLLVNAVRVQNDSFVYELLLGGLHAGNPHDEDSAWQVLVNDPLRMDCYNTGDSRQVQHYHKVLQAFVDRFKQNGLLESRDGLGNTLLAKAANIANTGAVTVLLGAGASVCTSNEMGLQPLSGLLYFLIMGQFPSMYDFDRPLSLLGTTESATEKAVVNILGLLLDAGADPNSGDDSGVRPIHLAIMAAWALNSTSFVEILCARGADSNAPSTGLSGARPLHIALEAPVFVKAWVSTAWWLPGGMLSLDEEIDKKHARYLETVKSLVRILINSKASFKCFHFADGDKDALTHVLCKCNALGLQAMLEEDVSIFDALGTGEAAWSSAAKWIEQSEKRRAKLEEPIRNISSLEWMEKRISREQKASDVLINYLMGPTWIQQFKQIKALLEQVQVLRHMEKAYDVETENESESANQGERNNEDTRGNKGKRRDDEDRKKDLSEMKDRNPSSVFARLWPFHLKQQRM